MHFRGKDLTGFRICLNLKLSCTYESQLKPVRSGKLAPEAKYARRLVKGLSIDAALCIMNRLSCEARVYNLGRFATRGQH